MIERQFGIETDPNWRESSDTAPQIDKGLFLSRLRGILAAILQSEVGRDLAASLRYYNKPILVVPYLAGDFNAQEWWWGSSPQGHYSMIRFSPGSPGRSPCAELARNKRPATLPQEVLFHELVHSFRRMSGKMRGWQLSNSTLAAQGNIEEFIAIMVTNIFISDVTNHLKTSLRADWRSHSPLDPKLAESFRFFALGTKAFNLIATFCDDNPGFTKMLSKARAHFNPIAAYYRDRRKAFDIAADGDAENVFQGLTPLEYVQNPAGAWTKIIPFRGPSASSPRR